MFAAQTPAPGTFDLGSGVPIDITTVLILVAVVIFSVALAQLFLLILRAILRGRRRRHLASLSDDSDLD